MTYTALYREMRPKTFKDVVGQEHITTTLKNQIEFNRISHAYLLCGTRGTGKTTTAKVMAKALNCLNSQNGEPCNECKMCKKINEGLAIDVVELDAASNNGIDKIRDIIDDSKYPPQEARYKVYIMDEVHMLSIGAVNAFLKTLEEPPKNIVFILATTDPQKLPITILSRCQRFDFRRINSKDIGGQLRYIVDKKGVLADDKSLELIARTSDGAMRDALSILDQAIAMGDGAVSYEQVISMLGLVTNDNLFNITSSIIERNIEDGMNTIEDIVTAGKDVYFFIKELIGHFRNLLMIKVTNNPEDVLDMSLDNIQLVKEQGARIRVEEIMRDIRILQEAEANAKLSKEARLYLELALIKMCKIEYDTSNEVILARINKLEEGLRSGAVKVEVSKKQDNAPSGSSLQEANKSKLPPNKEASIKQQIQINKDSKITIDDVKRSWKDILESCKSRRVMIVFASLMTGKPISCSDGVLTIQFEEEYSQSKERLEVPTNYKLTNEIISEVLGERLSVKFVIKSTSKDYKDPEEVLRNTIGEFGLEVLDE